MGRLAGDNGCGSGGSVDDDAPRPTVAELDRDDHDAGRDVLAQHGDSRDWWQVKPLDIARVCHEVNRAYCEALGDHSQKSWDDAPKWQRDSKELGVKLHLEHPEVGAQASHVSWMDQKVGDGWIYGPTKDEVAKTHPCLIPFENLPVEQQAKDFIFRAVVLALENQVVRT